MSSSRFHHSFSLIQFEGQKDHSSTDRSNVGRTRYLQWGIPPDGGQAAADYLGNGKSA